MKRKQHFTSFGLAVAVAAGAHVAAAQQGDPQPMSFFITSVGLGDGANLGGLEGADAHCQSLAAKVGRGDSTWRAYLSTQGTNAVSARDRIGGGPWYAHGGRRRIATRSPDCRRLTQETWYAHGGRRRIATDLAMLHGDTLELARLGISFGKGVALTEQGDPVPGLGDRPNRHDILTGTQPDGRAYSDDADHTCGNWTSNSEDGSAQVGHHDKQGGPNGSWNSAHPSRGCSQANLEATGGAGLFYCFAID